MDSTDTIKISLKAQKNEFNPAKYGIKMLLNWLGLEIQKWTIWPESADQAGLRNTREYSDYILCIMLITLLLN